MERVFWAWLAFMLMATAEGAWTGWKLGREVRRFTFKSVAVKHKRWFLTCLASIVVIASLGFLSEIPLVPGIIVTVCALVLALLAWPLAIWCGKMAKRNWERVSGWDD